MMLIVATYFAHNKMHIISVNNKIVKISYFLLITSLLLLLLVRVTKCSCIAYEKYMLDFVG